MGSPVIWPTIFSIRCISTNCFSRRFTSSTVVPLPFAMRLRRLPSRMSACFRSAGVIELMIASIRPSCFSSGFWPASSFMPPIPGSMPMIFSSGPIRFSMRS